MIDSLCLSVFCLLGYIVLTVGFPAIATLATKSVPSHELAALEDLFNSTRGTDWIWKSVDANGPRWFNGSANPCEPEWQGVLCVCITGTCNVEELYLPGYNLNGTLPATIGNFTELANLQLSNNSLQGRIPGTIGQLTRLNYLAASSNNFTGPIPNELYSASSLNLLSLSENALTGSITNRIAQMEKLVSLDLFSNNMTGTLPPALGSLKLLRTIQLCTNNFSGPIDVLVSNGLPISTLYLFENQFNGTISNEICNMADLTAIEMNNNQLSGSIPLCIGQLLKLEMVTLNNNPLNGTIPEGMFHLPNLRNLWMYETHLSGSISNSIGNMSLLENLALQQTNMSGTIPESIGNLLLQYLYVFSAHFYGSLPETLFNCPLVEFAAYENYLTGTIPAQIEQVDTLITLEIYENKFEGTLPKSICLPNLVFLVAYNNLFNGTLPECLFQMEALTIMIFNNNSLSGTLPSQMQMSSIMVISLYSNYLEGTLPPALGSLSTLGYFYINTNKFNGSIPEEIYQIKNLRVLDLFGNEFTGTLSDSIGNFTQMVYFDCYLNSLAGSVPSSLCDLQELGQLNLAFNYFSGQYPECLWLMPNIALVSISENQFTGTMPSSLESMVKLSELFIFSNSFDGQLPSAIPQSMLYFEVDDNYLTGSIPSSLLTMLDNVVILYFGQNLLTGTVPVSLGELSSVSYLILEDNMLSGSLPALNQLTDLYFLFASNNLLSGAVTNLFSSHTQRSIQNIDLSSNHFSGQLPDDVFNIPTLETFAAVSNCFTGTIPISVCNATRMTALALDGLHTASSCQRTVLPLVSNSYGLDYYWKGGVPACVFDLPLLVTLHVSGNGIGGSLASELVLSPVLIDLALSYNQLTGHIPNSFGNVIFENIDLSFNRLGGILSVSPNQPTDTTVSYEVNRLSGNIPSVLIDIETISVLNGNHFLCRFDRDQLPKHDKQYSYYECGTSSLDKSIYLWVGLLVAATTGVVFVLVAGRQRVTFGFAMRKAKALVECFTTWMNIFRKHDSNPLNVQLLGIFMRDLRRCFALLTLYVVLLLVPVNVMLSHYYDAYQYPYAWSVGSVYLSGYTAAVVLCLLFALLLLWMMGVFAVCLTASVVVVPGSTSHVAKSEASSGFRTRIVLSLALIAIFNFAVVLSVNVGYVLVATRFNPTIVAVTQIAVSIYKLVWNDLIIRNLVGWVHRYWSSVCGLSAAEESEWSGSYMTFNTFTMIFNVIVIPCMATAAVSSDCFYDVLVPPSAVDSYYVYRQCSAVQGAECTAYLEQINTTSYLPPYMYRYQCSSTLVATYAILYVYNFIILSFFQPLLVLLLMWLKKDMNSVGLLYKALISVGVFVTDASRLFDKDRFNLRMIMYLSIFVTFGVIFPPLAVMILVTVVVQTYFTQLHLGHFIAGAGVESESNRWIALQVLDESCKGVSVLFKQTVYVVCPCAAFFYAYTVYDTYADAGGGSAAVWMSCSLFVAGCLVTAMYKVWVDRVLRSKYDDSIRSSTVEIAVLKKCTVNPMQ